MLPFLPYGVENIVRITHDVGTSLMVAALVGQGYFRLLPENRWMLRTTLGGDQEMRAIAPGHGTPVTALRTAASATKELA